MKKNKKLFSVLLSLMLVFTVFSNVVGAAPVISDTKGSLTLTKKSAETLEPLEGAEYTIYKVANITQSNESGNVKLTYDSLVAGKTINSTTKVSDFSDTDLEGLTSYVKTTPDTGLIKFDNLDLGIYLVKETKTPAGVTSSNDFIVSIPMSTGTEWVYNVEAEPKNSAIDASVDKNITGGTEVNSGVHSASVGESVEYTIDVTLPSDFKTAGYSLFDIKDTTHAALQVDITSIEVKNLRTNSNLTLDTDYRVVADTDGFTVKLVDENSSISNNLLNGDKLTIKYSAKLLTTATPGTAITNNVQINYQTVKGGDPAIVSPPDEILNPPTIYTYKYTLKKVDGNGNALGGAKFAIKNDAGKFLGYDSTDGWKEVATQAEAYIVTSDAGTGLVTFSGLKQGSYNIVETEAPTGYSLLSEEIAVTINNTTTGEAHSIQVENKETGFTLPQTGGKGIAMLIMAGMALVGISVLMFRKSEKNLSK